MLVPVVGVLRHLVQGIKQVVDPLPEHVILEIGRIEDLLQMLDPRPQHLLHAIPILKDHLETGLLLLQEVDLGTYISHVFSARHQFLLHHGLFDFQLPDATLRLGRR